MKQFLVEFSLPNYLDEEFMELIPQQQMEVGKMFREGVLASYTLAKDKTKLWATFEVQDAIQIEGLVDSLPLTSRMHYDIHELLFNEQVFTGIPAPSLN